jgi:hypothetical protein
MTGSRVVTGAQSLTVSSISVYVGSVSAGDQFSVAIYADSSGRPGALVAQSANSTLQGSAWNSAPLVAVLAPNTAYWLMFNANGTSPAVDNMVYTGDSAMVGAWAAQSFGSWPTTFGSSTLAGQRYSMYATVH